MVKAVDEGRLAGSGHAVQDGQGSRRLKTLEVVVDMIAEGLVAAGKLEHPLASRLQQDCHGAAAQPSAPAVDQHRPPLGVVDHLAHHVGEAAAGQLQSAHAGLPRPDPVVDGADLHPLLIGQDRDVDGPRQVVLVELQWRPDIDDTVAVQLFRCE